MHLAVGTSFVSNVIAAGPRTATYTVGAAVRPFRRERQYPEIPAHLPTPGLAASILGEQVLSAALRAGSASSLPPPEAVRLETYRTIELLGAKGWLDDPRGFHQQPPPLLQPNLEERQARGLPYQVMSFDSAYSPAEGSQHGESRWDASPNRTARAFVLRHGDGPRPWLVFLHGYGAGSTWDIETVGARLHRVVGLNVVAPVAPYHGERRIGRRSGTGMMSVDHVRTLHAFGQAIWDTRRCISWAEADGATSVSVCGVSMGGYLAALLAGVDDRLERVIAVIPATDMAAAILRRTLLHQWREAERHGLLGDCPGLVYRPVSPLVLPPAVPRDRRFIVGATADQITRVGNAYRLWQHWDEPEVLWYRGTHIGAGLSGQVWRWVEEALSMPEALSRRVRP